MTHLHFINGRLHFMMDQFCYMGLLLSLKEYQVILQVFARKKRYKAYHVPKQKFAN